MKQIWFLIAAILFILSGCTQQENKLQNTELSNDKDAPIEDIVVKKEYDEDGNIRTPILSQSKAQQFRKPTSYLLVEKQFLFD